VLKSVLCEGVRKYRTEPSLKLASCAVLSHWTMTAEEAMPTVLDTLRKLFRSKSGWGGTKHQAEDDGHMLGVQTLRETATIRRELRICERNLL
jgi:hypothetical protein